jgi:uncharacterized protein with von Willebrand factor type A (vWA) domain
MSTRTYPPEPVGQDGHPLMWERTSHGGDVVNWAELCSMIDDASISEQDADVLINGLAGSPLGTPVTLNGDVYRSVELPPTTQYVPLDHNGDPVSFTLDGSTATPVDWDIVVKHVLNEPGITAEAASELLKELLENDRVDVNGFVITANSNICNPPSMLEQPEAPALDPTTFSGAAQEAFDADGEGDGPEFSDPTFMGHAKRFGGRFFRRRPKPSDTVLKLDQWSINKGKRLAQDELHKDMVKAKLTDATELADAHAACFDLFTEFAERPKDVSRARWMQEMVNTPDFQALREQTAYDMGLSDIACQTVTKQWVEYKKMVKSGQDEELSRARSAANAAKQAKNQVNDASGMARAFGLERGSRQMQDPTRMLELFKKIKKTPSLKNICELAGAYRRLAQARQRVKDIHSEDEIVDVTLGGELERLMGSEISRLAVEELEDDMLRRLMEHQAMCRQMQGVKHVAKGPIMVLLDESGSMSGEPNEQAKAMSLALAYVAKSQKRWCALVSWSSAGQYNYITLPPGEWDGNKVADWCCGFIGGGTEPPIQIIEQIYEETGASGQKCDMVWISDGCAHVDPGEAEKFNEWRHARKSRSIGLLVQSDDAAFKLICDEIHVVKAISVTEDAVGQVLGI